MYKNLKKKKKIIMNLLLNMEVRKNKKFRVMTIIFFKC